MQPIVVSLNLTPSEVVARCQAIMAHAWMVRTFLKHSPEIEDFPELMRTVRTIFDTARALETRIDDPPAYLQMLRKKIGKLRQAASQFRIDAPQASDHTNFKQAVISLDTCVAELDSLLQSLPAHTSRSAPASTPQPAVTTEPVLEIPADVTLVEEDQGE